MTGTILLQNNPHMFVLFVDDRDRHLLTVTTGGVAMAGATIEVTAAEARDLAGNKAKAIELARRVATKTSVFEERRVRPARLPDAA